MSSSVRDITESTEAEGRDDTHQTGVCSCGVPPCPPFWCRPDSCPGSARGGANPNDTISTMPGPGRVVVR